MVFRLAQLSFVAVLGLTGAALAADGSPVTAPASTDASHSSQGVQADPMVCRSMGPPTGSRLGARKICQHQSQWDQQEQDARDSINKVQHDATLKNPQG